MITIPQVDMKRISGVDSSRQETPDNKGKGGPSKQIPKIDFSKETVPVNYLAKVVGNKDAFLRKKESYVQKNRTFFKFNEGYSNAVRKPVKMSAFF